MLELKNAFKNKFANVLFDEPMKKHTTFKIGGNADVFIIPNDSGEIIDAIKLCEEFKAPFYIIGNGSNILVGDGGINGVVIQIFKNMGNIGVNGNIIKAEGGALLSLISRKALEEGLTGLEFASGIPGTVGGGVCMNAGAYGGEMKDIISKVVVLKNGEILELSNEESEFEIGRAHV